MRRVILLIVAAVVAIADLTTKSLAFSWIERQPFPHRIHWIFGDWFGFVKVMNPGVTGGMGSGIHPGLLTAFTVVAVVGIALYLLIPRHPSLWVSLPLAMILGGAVGNLWDRFAFGEVRDFIDVWPRFFASGWLHHWPTFNLADSAIVAGVATLIFHALFLAKKEERAAAAPATADEG